MAFPTLKNADDYLVALLEQTSSGGAFGTAARYRAIYMVANRIQWVTQQYVRSTNVSLVNGTTSYDLTGASYLNDDNASWERIISMRIGNYPALQQYAYEDVIREELRLDATGRPLGYFPLDPCTLLLDKDPDQAYTLVVRDAPEISFDLDTGTPSGVTIQLPAMWLYGGLDVLAWHYLTRTRDEYGYSGPATAVGERWLATLQSNDPVPVVVRPDASYGVTGGYGRVPYWEQG